MSVITLQFVNASDLGSRLINWFSAGRFSHVDALVPYDWLLGARLDNPLGYGSGVRKRPPGYATWQRQVLIHVQCTPEQEKRFYYFLEQQIGKPYDWMAIVAFVLPTFAYWFGRNWKKGSRWFCSEVAAAALEDCGVLQTTLLVETNKVTPVALAMMLSTRPDVTIEVIK